MLPRSQSTYAWQKVNRRRSEVEFTDHMNDFLGQDFVRAGNLSGRAPRRDTKLARIEKGVLTVKTSRACPPETANENCRLGALRCQVNGFVAAFPRSRDEGGDDKNQAT
jgi:hypothetical protein